MQDFQYAPPAIDTALCSKYDPTATYAVGALCIHDDRLYKCTTAISTAETWTAAHWTETSLVSEIALVKSAIPEVVNALNDTSTGKALSAAQGKALNDGKVNTSDIVDNLTTDNAAKVLSAKQGKALNDSKVNTSAIANNLTTTAAGYVLDARQGKALNDHVTNMATLLATKAFTTYGTTGGSQPTMTITLPESALFDTLHNLFIVCGVRQPSGNVDDGYAALKINNGTVVAMQKMGMKNCTNFAYNATTRQLTFDSPPYMTCCVFGMASS